MAPQLATEKIVSRLSEKTSSPVALLALDNLGRVGACFSGLSWSVHGFGSDLSVTNLATS
jgi:hypothetical protein